MQPRRRNGRITLAASLTLIILGMTACSSGSGGGALGAGNGSKLIIISNESPWQDAYQAVVAAYEEKTGTDVELRVFPYDEMRTQAINDVQSGGQIYDVFQIDEPYLHEFFENGWITPFSEIDPGFALGTEVNSYDDFAYWDAEKKISSADGAAMVMPLNGNIGLLQYRTDVYEDLGLDVPTTWDQVLTNGETAQSSGLTKYGYVLRTQGITGGGAQATYDFLPLMYAFGANWFKDEGVDWTPSMNTPEGIKAITMYKDLAGLGPAETSTIGQAQAIGAMQSGESAQAQLVAAAAPALLSAADSNIVDRAGFAPLPAGDTGVGVASGVWGIGVPSGLPDDRATASMEFIEFVGSKEAQMIFAENGGIPTRDDIIGEADLDEATLDYLTAVQDSLPNVSKHVRYTFAAEMLPITEKYLAQIAAGTITPEQCASSIDAELRTVLESAGYPMGATS